jgi:hypothetical protein
MPKVNRFYQPATGKYLSQFVPQQLPTDLLIAPLAAKQEKYNQLMEKIELTKDWDQRAIGWHDKEFVKDIRSGIREKADYFLDKDLSDASVVREYQDWIRSIKENEDIKSIQTTVDKYDSFKGRWEELRKKGDYTAADELMFAWESELALYSKEGGLGFKDPNVILDPDIMTGFDLRQEREKIFNNLKESGWENISPGEAIWTTSGWKGVSGKDINENAFAAIDSYYNSNPGRQEQMLYDMRAGITPETKRGYTEEDRIKYETNKRNFVLENILNTGREFEYGVGTKDFKFDPGFEGLGASSAKTAPGEHFLTNADPFDYSVTQESVSENRKTSSETIDTALKNLTYLGGREASEIFGERIDEFKQSISRFRTGNQTSEDVKLLNEYVQTMSNVFEGTRQKDRSLALGQAVNGLANGQLGFTANNMVLDKFRKEVDFSEIFGVSEKEMDSDPLLKKIKEGVLSGISYEEFEKTNPDIVKKLKEAMDPEKGEAGFRTIHESFIGPVQNMYEEYKYAYDAALEDYLDKQTYKLDAITLEGSSETILSDFTKAMSNAVENRNTAWITVDGMQLSTGDLKGMGAKNFKLAPIVQTIHGRSGFLMSYENDKGVMQQTYVTAADDLNSADMEDVGLEAYKIGNRKEKEGSYSKANQLKKYGSFTMGFYAASGTGLPSFGKQIEMTHPELWETGDAYDFQVLLPEDHFDEETKQYMGTTMESKNVKIRKTQTGDFSLENKKGQSVFYGSIPDIQSFVGEQVIQTRIGN